ncbi:MAG: ISLre2 family transposase [Clostridia bacterium]|nr:ISLre2 family transposase [Clostridia bacterium]
MYNSILHFNDLGVKKIEERIKKFISEGKDIADLILGVNQDLMKLGRDIVSEVLEDMDEYLRQDGVRKKDWEIVRKDETGLLTTFGQIRYKRTYFKPKQGGKRKYLVDELAGIKPHERMSADVVINTLDEAIESSYRKAGEKASYENEVSKQAVMNKVHTAEVNPPKLRCSEKRDVRILYIEADEDHVAHQAKRKGGTRCLMPKLIYVHEGVDISRSTAKRKVVKNVRYFGEDCSSEDLWLQVAQYISEQYDEDKIETVYISGDGASWIKQGLNWIGKSRFVLDNHHLNKYIKVATAHLDDEAIYQGLKDALDWPDKEMAHRVFNRILELTENETKIAAVKDARKYIMNNWAGIAIKAEKGYEIVGCSAEGHVSHVLSNRLSSRPKGWSKTGVNQMTKLLVYKKNGGNIYDLVMFQKEQERLVQKEEIQDEIIRGMRRSGIRYESSFNVDLPAIHGGHKTGLYHALRKLVGKCS